MSDKPTWQEANSQTFIDYGRYFVPEREAQMTLIADLIDLPAGEGTVLELGCGEGLLAGTILARWPACRVIGLDGSAVMRARAAANLAQYGDRFTTTPFDLFVTDWRRPDRPVRAIVSSLVIHHLDGPKKARLYQDLYHMLTPGGALVIADLIDPVSPVARAAAAKAWDEAVHARALALDGHTGAFDYFQRERWNLFRYPDPMDKPSPLSHHLRWLTAAGFAAADVPWLRAGHAIYGGRRLPLT